MNLRATSVLLVSLFVVSSLAACQPVREQAPSPTQPSAVIVEREQEATLPLASPTPTRQQPAPTPDTSTPAIRPTEEPIASPTPIASSWFVKYTGQFDVFIGSFLQETASGDILVVAASNLSMGGDPDILVLKLDRSGRELWQMDYGHSRADVAHAVQATADGGCLIAGLTFASGSENADAWLLKLDRDGAIVWQKAYGGQDNDWASAIRQTSDGGYIVAGGTGFLETPITLDSFDQQSPALAAEKLDAWVCKLDPDGHILWQKAYSFPRLSRVHSIVETGDGGYLLAGTTKGDRLSAPQAWLLKLDSEGRGAWHRAFDIPLTQDYGIQDYWLVRMRGLTIAQRYPAPDIHSVQLAVEPMGDGSYLLVRAWETTEETTGTFHAWGQYRAFKVDAQAIAAQPVAYDGPGYNLRKTGDSGLLFASSYLYSPYGGKGNPAQGLQIARVDGERESPDCIRVERDTAPFDTPITLIDTTDSIQSYPLDWHTDGTDTNALVRDTSFTRESACGTPDQGAEAEPAQGISPGLVSEFERAAVEKVTWLQLIEREITALPPEIGDLQDLQYLHLGDNHLTRLPPEIGKLTNLQVLYLHNNQLTELPAEIGQLTSLKALYLSGNQLTGLPPEIGQLTNLEYLGIDDNQLAELPAEMGQLTNLKDLGLENNRLTGLPAEIGRLRLLERLDVGHNALKTVPPEIGQLQNLGMLTLRSNELTGLPPEFGRLRYLWALDLSHNCIAELPAEFGGLAALDMLDLNHNCLTTLPPEIGQLTGLSSLPLDDNLLVTLPPEIGQLNHVRSLYLSNNQLTSVPPEIGQMAALEHLYLDGNRLTGLPAEIGQLSYLRVLKIEGNSIVDLPPEILAMPDVRISGWSAGTDETPSVP